MNDFIDLQRIFGIILKRWWLLLGMTVLAAVVGYMVSQKQTPVYEATSTLILGQISQLNILDRTEILNSEVVIQTYADIVRREPILEEVVRKADLKITWQELRKLVSVNPVSGSQLMEIKVEAHSPEEAAKLADLISNQLLIMLSAEEHNKDTVQVFMQNQIDDLQISILNGKDRIRQIETEIAGTTSTTRKVELQNELTVLRESIISWETNFIELTKILQQQNQPAYLTLIGKAEAKSEPIRPNIYLNTIISSVLGFMLALGLIFVLENFDDTYKSFDDISRFENLNVLGAIGTFSGDHYSEMKITFLEPNSPISETYRIIRSKLLRQSTDGKVKSIVVTSPTPGDGKSVSAINIATALAQASYKTVVVDADMRRPVIHEFFEVTNEVGLSDLLIDQSIKVSDCLHTTRVNRLKILTSGQEIQDPSERLASDRMTQIIEELEEKYDVIIIDSPPVLPVADVLDLSNHVDGVLLVVRAGKTKRKDIKQAFSNLSNTQATYLGSVLNSVPTPIGYSSYNKYYKKKSRLYPKKYTIQWMLEPVKKSLVLGQRFIERIKMIFSRNPMKPQQPISTPDQIKSFEDILSLYDSGPTNKFSKVGAFLANLVRSISSKRNEDDGEYLRQLAQKKKFKYEQEQARHQKTMDYIKNITLNEPEQNASPDEQSKSLNKPSNPKRKETKPKPDLEVKT